MEACAYIEMTSSQFAENSGYAVLKLIPELGRGSVVRVLAW